MARLILITFIGIPENDEWEACHKNDVRNDDRLENLEWNSHQYNMEQIRKKANEPSEDDIF